MSLESVSVFSEAQTLLHKITFELRVGETTVITGPSGSGKTRLAEMIAGAPLPEGLTVTGKIEGRDCVNIRNRTAIMLRQNAHMLFHPYFRLKRVIDDVARSWSCELSDTMRSVLDVLERFGLSEGCKLLNRHPHELSGGQRQRIALAIPLAVKAPVVILDESFSNLDDSNAVRVMKEYERAVREAGITLVATTHRPQELQIGTARMIVMDRGTLVEQGDKEQLLLQPEHALTRSLVEWYR